MVVVCEGFDASGPLETADWTPESLEMMDNLPMLLATTGEPPELPETMGWLPVLPETVYFADSLFVPLETKDLLPDTMAPLPVPLEDTGRLLGPLETADWLLVSPEVAD